MKRMIKHVALAMGICVGMVSAEQVNNADKVAKLKPMLNKSGLPGIWNTKSARALGKGWASFNFSFEGILDNNFFDKIEVPKEFAKADEHTSPQVGDFGTLDGYVAFALGINDYLDMAITQPFYLDGLGHAGTYGYPEDVSGAAGDAEFALKANFSKIEKFYAPAAAVTVRYPLLAGPLFSKGRGVYAHKPYYHYSENPDSVAYYYTSDGIETDVEFVQTLDFRHLPERLRFIVHNNIGFRFIGNSDKTDNGQLLFNLAGDIRVTEKFSTFGEVNWEPRFGALFGDSYKNADGTESKRKLSQEPVKLLGGVGFILDNGLSFQFGGLATLGGGGDYKHLIKQTNDVMSGNDDVALAVAHTTSMHPKFKLFFSMAGAGFLIPQDRDGDGYKDNKDQCPLKAEDFDGFKDSDGCPDLDNDHDGIKDVDDKCPGKDDALNTKEDMDGFDDEDGCPEGDNDGDGINDMVDRCPRDPEDMDGFEDGDGCPEKDNDLDGIKDADDKCPIEAEDKDGFEDEDGCPELDNDKDGINDKLDKCPNQAEVMNGVDDVDGCPDEVKATTIKKGRIVLRGVNFKSGKAILTSDSYVLLDKVIESLRDWPDVKIKITGHTDSVGGARGNQQLSYLRAKSVMRYMVQEGVDQSRLKAVGMGEDDPVASNATAAGRAENRRVEMERFDK